MGGANLAAVSLGAVGGAVATLLVVALVISLRRRNRTRADLEAMLGAAQREADLLRARLDELTEPAGKRAEQAYVITDAGTGSQLPVPEDQVAVPDRLVLTATVGQPLVKVVAFGHGVRRALSPQSRNRIWFEMRREVRAARKRRRRLVRDYLRDVHADDRATESLP